MSDQYIIDTPENIEFAYEIAGIGSRFLAAIIDSLLILVLQGILAAVMAGIIGWADAQGAAQSALVAVWSLLSFIFLWGYYMLFEELWNGQSPGKRLIGLRVVRTGGRPTTFIASAIRNLVRVIDFLPVFYGLGVVVMFIDPRSRRLGDLAAGTLVVREQRFTSLDTLLAASTPPALPLNAESQAVLTLPNIGLITATAYDLITEFLSRRTALSPEARARIATRLAFGLRNQLGMPQQGDPELFLEYAARQYRLSQSLRAKGDQG
jgi:uncharacterized RDD family membrane protein YckC